MRRALAVVAMVLLGALGSSQAVFAAPLVDCDSVPKEDWGLVGCDSTEPGLLDRVPAVVNVMFFIIGIVSVAFIIYGGIRYSTSAGDASKVSAAKNTIMYAVVGLIVALLAYAIVVFVMRAISS